MMFIKIMVIFLQKKTQYKSKYRAISFLQIFQTNYYYLHLTTSIKKKAQWSKTNRTFQNVFHASQAIKYVIKPGQNSLSAASLIIFFDFRDTKLLIISALIEIIHTSLFIFVSIQFAFILLFFSERKFSTTKRSHYVSIIQPQAWCIFSLSPHALFFKMFNSLF